MDIKALERGIYEIEFQAELSEKAAQTDRILKAILDKQIGIPPRLHEAMEYMLLSPGKRIRSALVQWVCELLKGQGNRDAEIASAAIEMVHTYSLIHDDLPAMDDDDLRRGRPSCHKQYDEPTAILAGDALLTLAFETLAAEVQTPVTAIRMIRILAEAAGPAGMIAGQMADLEAEHSDGTQEQLRAIHIRKTGRMFFS